MTQFPKTSGWPERIWRNANVADIARGLVPGAKPFAFFGEHISTGAVARQVLWETGMPATLTVPAGIGLSLVSNSAGDIGRRLKLAYLDGDLLAVQKTSDAKNGQIVVARLGDEVTVKRFRRTAACIELIPENPDFQTIRVPADSTDFSLEGLAVGLIRNTLLS